MVRVVFFFVSSGRRHTRCALVTGVQTCALPIFERKLVTASALTGAMIDPADHDRLIRAARAGENPQAVEATPLYRRSVAPIRRLRDELSLTYLYTQVLGGGADLFYVLDGTEGEDHSHIGSEDEQIGRAACRARRVHYV